MAICAVCSNPCRGHCHKCNARLCHQHMPTTARSKCALCPGKATTHNLQTPTPMQPPASRLTSTPTPTPTKLPRSRSYVQPYTLPMPTGQPAKRKAWEDMTPAEALQEVQEARTELLAKQKRERAYLDRRAARGTYTPTDEAYERDQILEERIVALLDTLEKSFRKDFGL